MPVERAAGGTSLIDVLDRVLDKGIVIDAWVRVSLVGIDLITVEARVVVASIDTYLKYSEAVGQVAPVSRPQAELAHQDVIAENAALRAELAASPRNPGGRRTRVGPAGERLRGGAARSSSSSGDGRAAAGAGWRPSSGSPSTC
jgi:gas vesicle structural protein